MAIDALRAELLIFHDARMTYVAVEIRMRAFEGELEARQVIEIGDPPEVIAVAVAARRSQSAHVLVVRFVTAGAILRNRVFQVSAAMAVTAADPRVAPE
jgi:hypothetical protein